MAASQEQVRSPAGQIRQSGLWQHVRHSRHAVVILDRKQEGHRLYEIVNVTRKAVMAHCVRAVVEYVVYIVGHQLLHMLKRILRIAGTA